MERSLVIAAFMALLLARAAAAELKVEAPHDAGGEAFRANVAGLMAALQGSKSKTLQRLAAAAQSAPADIVIKPVTKDPATWLHDVDRSSAHAAPADALPKGRARTAPTVAIVYVPPKYLDPKSPQWKSGVFVHELLHAVDIAWGRWSGSDSARERRGVFIQNLWRDGFGLALRKDYHGKYQTLDYQRAKAQGRIDEVAEQIFAGPGFRGP